MHFIPWSALTLLVGYLVSAPSASERTLVMASAALALSEAFVVTAVAMFFSSFSTPFMSAAFTLGVFLVGQSADTLANLPVRYFGETIRRLGRGLAYAVPNLNAFVPPRPLLLGELPSQPVWSYVALSTLHGLAYAAFILVVAA